MREDVVAAGTTLQVPESVIFTGVSLDDFHLCALAGRALSFHAA
jgi:hypothetical protein